MLFCCSLSINLSSQCFLCVVQKPCTNCWRFLWSTINCHRSVHTLCLKINCHLLFLECQTWTDFNNFWYTESWGNVTPEGCKFVHLTWNMSPHYLVKHRTSIHWLFAKGILLRNFLFKQLRCELKILKSMDFYFFIPKSYRFPHKKWTQLVQQRLRTLKATWYSLPSVFARTFSSDTSLMS